jgi:DNA-binding LacI/PurR family transcriptional regulator|tara:strand:+ start:226 stop:366 length:141 start_codon:yes stop_codon:yes gene_type:complete
MAVSPHQLGRRLAQVLLDRSKTPNMRHVNVTVPTKLIVRGKTAKPA